ncbi:MAG TPA: pyridoxal phosphate-dependent aminotransferase [Planctomycetota bacterium]|nr:pyridoxal phosphate-dependent aminotransferase [Planctomycetota bacterium]
MPISRRVADAIGRASWIRRMFEEGIELKKRHGEAAVCDLSLGNPDLEPPARFSSVLAELARDPSPGTHRYMPNVGLPEARVAVASMLAREQGVDPGADGVCMTVGAAGALNVVMKSLLDPGDEVVVPSPFFPEYEFYAENHQGKLVPVKTREDFSLDLDAMRGALTPRTKIVLVNAPNNPTGRIYPAADLRRLATVMEEGAPQATLVSDEPYRRLVFGKTEVPSVFAATPRSVVCSSFSKDLGLAGERIGFLAVHPGHPDRAPLLAAVAFAQRTLGFVNAPAILQRAVARLTDASVDVAVYRDRCRFLLDGLRAAGYRCVEPEGGMFLFPAAPGGDDLAFVQRLARDERVLVVPGTGFGAPGHFRVALSVPREVLERALPRMARAR